MRIPYCQPHRRTRAGVVPDCDGCREEAEALQAIAQRPPTGRAAPLKEGDVYMVWLKDEGRAMMARLFRAEPYVQLMPINLRAQPVFKYPRDIEIRGRVITTIGVRV